MTFLPTCKEKDDTPSTPVVTAQRGAAIRIESVVSRPPLNREHYIQFLNYKNA